MANKIVKIIGFAATAIGVASTVITDWVNEKKMNEMIEEKVNKALAERENEEDYEEF